MKEYNKDILHAVIAKLPEYEAPEFVWSNIEAVLIEDEQEQQIAQTIPGLPSFEAPTSIWEGIEAALENTAPIQAEKQALVFRLGRVAIAASLLGFAIWLGYSQFASNSNEYTLVYSEEEVSQFNYEIDLEADEAAFSEMLTQFESSIVARQHEAYDLLIDEFDELNTAKDELKTMMDNYGTDPDIIEQISEIERERSKVIKKMAAIIFSA